MQLYNSRTRKIEEFKPVEPGMVKIYTCGPTVYDHAHVGNLRSYTFADLLKKTFLMQGYSVKHIMNITDFGHLVGDAEDGEDKMSLGLKREGLPRTLDGMRQLADKYTNLFIEDMGRMNFKMPDFLPRASENVEEYVKIIEGLDKKGFVYKTSDGLYFDTEKDSNYGYMSLLKNSHDSESRIGMNSEKKNPADFALWKFADENGVGFPSPFGFGFPGWHIECSGMAIKYLGETMDVHTGGIDLMSVHHTNEIAQSENFTGKTFSNFFCHNAFLDIDNAKMSKSKNNFFTLQTIIEKGFSPLSYRYLILQTHYRQNLNFTWDNMQASENALKKLRSQVVALETQAEKNYTGELATEYLTKFQKELEEDLNTPQALATLWTLMKDETIDATKKYWTVETMDDVLSLNLLIPDVVTIPDDIQALLNKRIELRKEKNFAEADRIRDEIIARGYEVKDK